jgi:uncharacterized protein
MNISKVEQRVLHVLALGGRIETERATGGKVAAVLCVTREGFILSDCTLDVFRRLRQRKFVRSDGGAPYRISREGRLAVRAQTDNQG